MATAKRIKITRRIEKAEDITIKNAYEEFINEKIASNVADQTIKNYNKSFKLFMEFFEFDEGVLMKEIDSSMLYEWMGTLKVDGLKGSSINTYLRNLKVFLLWAMDEDRGYLQHFKFPKLRGQEEPMKLFTDEEIEKLLEKPRNPDNFVEVRTWMVVNWVLATGNRGATIIEVKIGDVDFKRKEISIRQQKNKKVATIPLSPTLETMLKKYIKEWRGDDPDKYLFPGIGDEQMTTSNLRQSFARYCVNRGVSRTNLHGLRHNFAKYWVMNGGNIFTLQRVLQHSTLEMTRRYVRIFGEDLKEDYEKFSALDAIKKTSKRTQAVKKNS